MSKAKDPLSLWTDFIRSNNAPQGRRPWYRIEKRQRFRGTQSALGCCLNLGSIGGVVRCSPGAAHPCIVQRQSLITAVQCLLAACASSVIDQAHCCIAGSISPGCSIARAMENQSPCGPGGAKPVQCKRCARPSSRTEVLLQYLVRERETRTGSEVRLTLSASSYWTEHIPSEVSLRSSSDTARDIVFWLLDPLNGQIVGKRFARMQITCKY